MKRCPFCGGKGVLFDHSSHEVCYVYCERCEAIGPVRAKVDEAREAWNQRVTPTTKDNNDA